MSYVFTKKKVVRRKVVIREPMDGDAFETREVFVTWEILSSKERGSAMYDEEFFRRVISNIEGVVDADTGKPFENTPEFREAFIAVEYHLSALQREYINCTVAAGRGN